MDERTATGETQVFDGVFYVPQPPTERLEPIRAALKVLANPEIPDEHAEKNHNCGECWACIEGTVALIGFARRQRTTASTPTDGNP